MAIVVGFVSAVLLRRIKSEVIERRKAEEKLKIQASCLQLEKNNTQRERDKLGAILSSMGEGLVVVDKKQQIMFMSQTAGAMLKVAPTEVINKKLNEYFCCYKEGEEMCHQNELIDQAIDEMNIMTINASDKVYCQKKEDKSFPIAMVISPFFLKGKISGVIIVLRDASKEKEVNNSKDEFLLTVSHQLRTPLSTVQWYIEMLLDGEMNHINRTQKQYLLEVDKGYKRMVKIVDSLLLMSDIELGKLAYVPRPSNVALVINKIFEQLKSRLKDKKITLKSNIKLQKSTLPVDNELFRVLTNIVLDNAIKYTGAGGKINMSLEVADGTLSFKVEDTGFGIPKNEQNKVFGKLFRASNIIKKDTDGSGLGLYIAKAIVDKAGGKIWFDSKEGKGTDFYFSLPLPAVE